MENPSRRRAGAHSPVTNVGKTGLSVFILAKDAERDIRECLESLRSVMDEAVVVADADSRDGTADAARALGADVFVRPFEGFARMKQFAMSKCTRSWALNVDTDERPDETLLASLARVKAGDDPATCGYAVNRLPFFLGKPIRHGGWYPDWVMRLVRPERASYPDRPVHERIEVEGPTSRLSGHLLHYTVRDWQGFLAKQRRFAALSTATPSVFAKWTRPLAAFLKSAVLKLGVLDGWRGCAVAYAQAYYAFHKYGPKTNYKETRKP